MSLPSGCSENTAAQRNKLYPDKVIVSVCVVNGRDSDMAETLYYSIQNNSSLNILM